MRENERRIRELFHRELTTTLLADAAHRADVPLGVGPPTLGPLSRGMRLAGPVRTVKSNNDLVATLAAVDRAEAGEVVVIANRVNRAGLIGDLIGTEATRKGLAGFVVDGFVRDSADLIALGVPVFCRGRVPVGPLKLAAEHRGTGEIDVEVEIGEARVRRGDWAFGDGDGVLFLPAGGFDRVLAGAEEALAREEALAGAVKGGEPLGDLLEVEAFLEERARRPEADFSEHLARVRRAI